MRCPTREERFRKKYKWSLTGCWLWQAATRNAYGRFWNGKRMVNAHCFSHELYIGPIPDGLFVLHECNNPSCVRPSHLFLGTQFDNIHDMIQKGRRVIIYGSKRSEAKLTEAIIKEVRASIKEKQAKKFGAPCEVSILAKKFGVTTNTMRNAINGVTWKHVT